MEILITNLRGSLFYWDTLYNQAASLDVIFRVSCTYKNEQESLLSQRGRAMLRVWIASMQNVERSLLLSVFSASDIPLHTIKFFSVLFSSAYSSMLQAVTNKHSLVRRRLCDLYTAWSSVTVFVTS